MAACLDLTAAEDELIEAGQRRLIKTGLRVRVPEGYVLEILPRSGNALKKGLTVLNSPGQIDADYRGEIGVVLYNADSRWSQIIRKGDRIAQCRLLPVLPFTFVEVDAIDTDETERGEGGYGSTG